MTKASPWVVLVAGLALGWYLTRAWYLDDVATLKLAAAQNAQAVQIAQNQRLTAAVARGDQLSKQLLSTEAVLATTQKERDRALKSQTTGRACLSAGAVGLLNSARGADTVPETASQPTAAGESAATDTDVAEWASNAITQYEVCRGRLDRLIDYNEGKEP